MKRLCFVKMETLHNASSMMSVTKEEMVSVMRVALVPLHSPYRFWILPPDRIIGGDNEIWHVLIFPKGNNVEYLSMYFDVAYSTSLPYGWNRYAQFSLAVVNQIQNKYTKPALPDGSILRAKLPGRPTKVLSVA
ncbi:unnamed protein product [Lupinus luteus]|uniref:MATH domain-containing protein n=1 Tax=Lupinus luteus TaxID=3873 RepID=A0AAV1WBF1_LUPLU